MVIFHLDIDQGVNSHLDKILLWSQFPFTTCTTTHWALIVLMLCARESSKQREKNEGREEVVMGARNNSSVSIDTVFIRLSDASNEPSQHNFFND